MPRRGFGMMPETRRSREARAPEAGRARELREQQTPAERMLWSKLRNRQFLGLKFRRQFPVEGFITDFCCYEARLILEVDGAVHAEPHQKAHDENRDIFLHSLGYEILRFSNQQVLTALQSVLDEIARKAGLPHTS
jgi:very-short-patch-repair endonuclease